MPVINQTAAGDTYQATQAKILNVWKSHGGWFSVGTFPAYVQLQYGKLGQPHFKDEELLGAGAFGFLPPDCIGVQFRNANAGSPAIITASIATSEEPALAISALGNITTSGRAPTRTVVTAAGAGVYNTPTNCVAILVECIGGGGGSGGCAATAAGQVALATGGGGGAYASSIISGPAATYAYVVGAAGLAGTNAPGNGGNGGDTSFNGAAIVAKGGFGGALGNAQTPPAVSGSADGGQASASTGNLLMDGGGTTPGIGPAAAQVIASTGGAAARGGGGVRGGVGTGAGIAGLSPGGGASGARAVQSAAAQVGAAGGVGMIIVTEFY